MDRETILDKQPLIGRGTLLTLLTFAMLWQSNPDEASFRRFLVRANTAEKTDGMADVFGRVVAPAAVALLDVQVVDYGVFSTATIYVPSVGAAIYVGVLGHWFLLDMGEDYDDISNEDRGDATGGRYD